MGRTLDAAGLLGVVYARDHGVVADGVVDGFTARVQVRAV